MAQILPTFVIIGAVRGGTTSLARYLGAHPQVFMTTPKEIHFFDLHFDRGVAWYAGHFTHAKGKKAIGEGTPAYMSTEEAIPRMAQVLPAARLIATLRNPVDRAYSHYWLNRSRGREPLEFAEALATEPARLADTSRPMASRRPYVFGGRYLLHLRRVCEYYPREALHVVLFEDLRDDPRATFAAVCRFLGVDETFVPANLGERVNRYVEFRSSRVRTLSARLPRKLRELVRRFNAVEASYPPMDPALRRELAAQFAAENAALAAWLGRDLSAWSDRSG